MTLDERMKSLNKDIHKQFEEYQKATDELTSENELLHSIIKEVREYIEKYDFITGYYEYNYDDGNDTYTHYTVKEELLEILDKAGDIK